MYTATKLLLSGAPVAPFTPASLSGLQVWLDASDSTTLFQDSALTTPATATNDPIGGWKDKSGNAKNATATLTLRPLLKLATQNGLPTIRWDGVNDVLLTSLSLPEQSTIFIAYANRSGVNGSLWSTNSAGGTAPLQREDSPAEVWMSAATTQISVTGAALNPKGILITAFDYAADQYQAIVNTISATRTTLTTNPGNVILFGARAGNTEFAAADLCEIAIYNRVLTGTEIASVRSYLNAKWAMF